MQSGLCTLLLSDTFNSVLSTRCYVLAIGLPDRFDHLRLSRQSSFTALIYCMCRRVCVGVYEEVRRQLCESPFSPSILWVPGFELTALVLAASAFVSWFILLVLSKCFSKHCSWIDVCDSSALYPVVIKNQMKTLWNSLN